VILVVKEKYFRYFDNFFHSLKKTARLKKLSDKIYSYILFIYDFLRFFQTAIRHMKPFMVFSFQIILINRIKIIKANNKLLSLVKLK
jgi:hypothetical protein